MKGEGGQNGMFVGGVAPDRGRLASQLIFGLLAKVIYNIRMAEEENAQEYRRLSIDRRHCQILDRNGRYAMPALLLYPVPSSTRVY